MKKLLVLVSVITLYSCKGEDIDTQTATATTKGAIKLINNASLPINHAYLSLSNSSVWGDDLLKTAIASNTSFQMNDIEKGQYDGKAEIVGSLSTYHAFLYGITVTANDTNTLTATNNGFTGSIKITNSFITGCDIVGIYVTLSSDQYWGGNYITSAIPFSSSAHIYDLAAGFYDIKVVWNIGVESYAYNQQIDPLSLTTVTTPGHLGGNGQPPEISLQMEKDSELHGEGSAITTSESEEADHVLGTGVISMSKHDNVTIAAINDKEIILKYMKNDADEGELK
jgi:hypothetical protein